MINRTSSTQYDDGNKITINMFGSPKIQRLSCEDAGDAQGAMCDWLDELIEQCKQEFPLCEFDYAIYQHEQEYQARMYAEMEITSRNGSYEDAATWMQNHGY